MARKFSPVSVKELIQKHRLRLVIFGDTHGFLDDSEVQTSLFTQLRPEFYLHEMIEEKKFLTPASLQTALSHNPDEKYSMISTYGELHPIFSLCLKFHLPLIGIDFKDMSRKDMHIFETDELTPEEEKAEQDLQERREHKHALVINEYLKKTSSFVVASMGAYHLREGSLTLADLDCDTYLLVYPSVNGELIMGPSEEITPEMIAHSVRLVQKTADVSQSK